MPNRRHGCCYAYLVQCADGTYYAGSTNNLANRLKQHNNGHGAKYVRGRGPVRVVYAREYRYARRALQAEHALKQLTRAQKEEVVKISAPRKFRQASGWTWPMVIALILVGAREVNAVASEASFAKWLSGANGFEQAMERRRGTSDVMLLYFYTDWCPYCRQLNQKILASPAMQQYVEHVIAVRINPEQGAQEKAIANAHGVTGYPTFLVLPPGANRPTRIDAFSKKDAASPTILEMTPEDFLRACEEAGRARKKTEQRSPSPTITHKTSIHQPKAPTSPTVFAPRHPVTLYLKNGNQLDGDLIKETPTAVTIGLESGEIVFERAEIKRLVRPAPEPASPDAP